MVKITLDPKTKYLMHKVMDGNLELVPILHELTRFVHLQKILFWLDQANIRGNNLLDWIRVEHQGSVMSMVQTIVMLNNKEKQIRPIILGKDWR